ncbi:MAG: hypothetical protein EOO54_12175 [Haliea sp.]|nr:MAG: hypothetical protein EOO54_12175 [Haliea sp.]
MNNTLDKNQLHGHWRLVSFREQKPDGSWFDALGPGATGCISYWPSGHMQVLIGGDDRPRLRGEWSAIPATAKADCLDRLVAYAGRFEWDGERLRHQVEVCWIPNWERRELIRLPSFPSDGQLLLRTEAATDGRPRPMQEVLWQRA